MKTINIVLPVIFHLVAMGFVYEVRVVDAAPITSPLSARLSAEDHNVDMIKARDYIRGNLTPPDPKHIDSDVSKRALTGSEEHLSIHARSTLKPGEVLSGWLSKRGGPPDLPQPPPDHGKEAAMDVMREIEKEESQQEAGNMLAFLKKRLPLPFGFDWYDLGAHNQKKPITHPRPVNMVSKRPIAPKGWKISRRPEPRRSPDLN